MTKPLSGRKPVFALLMRLLWATALAMPATGAQAGVILTTLYSFKGSPDGATPQAGLVQGSDGSFYGTTSGGGILDNNGYGIVFKISANGVLTNLYSFTGVNDGGSPIDALVQGSDGYLYGTTEGDGYNYGTVFNIGTNGGLTTLHIFSQKQVNGPAYPSAGLVQGSDGYFYGTTYEGGSSNSGVVFKMSTNSTTTFYSFRSVTEGANCTAGLVQGSDGYFYGTTEYGGTKQQGNVFRISTNGVLTNLYSFTNGIDGANPVAGLLLASDGNFYGTAEYGGKHQIYGTVFKITTNGALTSLYSFTGGKDGYQPTAGLVEGSDGYLYGTAFFGGTVGSGTVFKISTNGVLTSLHSFTGDKDGGGPNGVLVQGTDGSFYGTTSEGGTGGFGTVFRMTIEPEFQAATLTNSTLSLTWTTEVGGTYQLQFTSDLSSSTWIDLDTALTAIGSTLSMTDIVTNGPQRFYRLMVSP